MNKKIICLVLIALVLLGCSPKESGNNNNVTFDCVEYNTIEEMNEVVGTNIVSAAVAGKADERFEVISKSIAQYSFTVNGEEWCIRASKDVDNDISGLYYDSIGFEKDMNSTYYNDDVYMHRFFYNDSQYVIILDVKDKDISTSYFDNVIAELQTNITGVKSGYENELLVEGDDVILKTSIFNDDGTTTVMDTIYTFTNDKMSKITSSVTFENEEAAKEYYDLLIENGKDPSELVLDGVKITSDTSSNVDFYSDYTKDAFVEMMKSSLEQ